MVTKQTDAAADPAARTLLDGWLAAASAGDRRALESLYGRTAGQINALLRRMLGDEQAAAEILQDVYLTVWRRGATFDPARGSAMAWLIAVGRNLAIDRLRADRASPHARFDPLTEDTVADASASAFDALAQADTARQLGRCLDALQHDQRVAIRSAYFGGWTYEELAIRCGVPLSTMKSRIRRGLMSLRSCLGG